ncbi:hypothetical protein [Pontibacter sp. SGAir0037]|uniref:hypothetical protein n=1 Tax=Pontibacter sp. SGAir0037 TaxID=2571030 RepID=UPI0010CCBEC6|nr:hypothetical protein [Pontibacter sp. SGAir0037]QCR23943.1 hypothetical protein C1N53_17355 [Pontibacter sp. SGAir0037]
MAITACERPAPPSSAEAAASYNVGDYLQQEIQRLQAEKPNVLKSVQTENKPTETVETSELNWEKELSVFQDANINLPTLQDDFIEERQELPGGIVLTNYRRKEGTGAAVAFLSIRTAPGPRLQQLEAVIQEENMLFYSKRRLTLSTNENGNIASYGVDGVQKLIFGDSLHYRTDANL